MQLTTIQALETFIVLSIVLTLLAYGFQFHGTSKQESLQYSESISNSSEILHHARFTEYNDVILKGKDVIDVINKVKPQFPALVALRTNVYDNITDNVSEQGVIIYYGINAYVDAVVSYYAENITASEITVGTDNVWKELPLDTINKYICGTDNKTLYINPEDNFHCKLALDENGRPYAIVIVEVV